MTPNFNQGRNFAVLSLKKRYQEWMPYPIETFFLLRSWWDGQYDTCVPLGLVTYSKLYDKTSLVM